MCLFYIRGRFSYCLFLPVLFIVRAFFYALLVVLAVRNGIDLYFFKYVVKCMQVDNEDILLQIVPLASDGS